MSQSKFIQLDQIKLSDFFEVRTNRVLSIDDISNLFANADDEKDLFTDALTIDSTKYYNRFLVQAISSDRTQFQVSDLIVLNDVDNVYTLSKASITSDGRDEMFIDIYGYIDDDNNISLRLDPENPYSYDYEIKILQQRYSSLSAGSSTQSVGFVDIVASNNIVSSGSTSTILSLDSSVYNSSYLNVSVYNNDTQEQNYVEIYLSHDGSDTYLSEFYFDDINGNSSNFIGTFTSYIDSGNVVLDYNNDTSDQLLIQSRVVGFNTTSIGDGIYRFILPNQIAGNERSATYESNYSQTTGTTPIDVITLNKSIFTSSKSIVEVKNGAQSALHQLLTIHDNTNIHVTQYPFLSIGSTTGIGTFGGEYSGSDLIVKFYPDPTVSGLTEVRSFNENIYTTFDQLNIAPDLEFSPGLDSLKLNSYFGNNLNTVDRTNFTLNYQQTPIFMKKFNPSNLDVLDPVSGIFNIPNHFFNTGEELYYTPRSTFIGVGEEAVGIGETLNYVGVTTDKLPEVVYAIRINNSQFRLSTRPEYASAGIYVTFTSYGEGNAHELEMAKKNEKSIISINNIIQYPLTYTSINYILSNNLGSIGAATTVFALSGITSINPGDLLKIEDEYVLVNNVGFGNSNTGPITYDGSFALVDVDRGVVGSAATSHIDTTGVRVYRGSYNIVKDQIHFTNPPRGSGLLGEVLTDTGLPRERAEFNGRVFLRNNYSTNVIYDDISPSFTGLGQTFTITTQGINTVGLGDSGGNGLVLINGIFQSPTTINNSDNNYIIEEDTIAGVTSITFAGITDENGDIIISSDDVNQNQLPRGGLIVSLGSTGGLGYAPLIGAAVTATINGSGVITGFESPIKYGSGYRDPVSIGVTDLNGSGDGAVISATVGAGGTLAFTIDNGGTGYVDPLVIIEPPSYEALEIVGVSRPGIGTTTESGFNLLVDIKIGPGAGVTEYFKVDSFSVVRNGYGFRRGDVITPVGLVTASGLAEPIEQFQLIVTDIFNDSFAAWQFGELNYIDSVKNYQDNIRVTFPLFYNGELISFERSSDNADSQLIDMDALLLIFINGVLQVPNEAYTFTGGSTFTFTTPPKPEDNISIYFYLGTRDEDYVFVNVLESLKVGDTIQLLSNNTNLEQTSTQDKRVIVNIPTSERIETEIYGGGGVSDVYMRPLSWIKQKRDLIINNTFVSKTRDSIESQIYPTAKVIKDVLPSDTQIFLDTIELFDYDNEDASINNIECLLIDESKTLVAAGVTVSISIGGTVDGISITNAGSGYTSSTVPIKISRPPSIGVGIGTTASATATITNGSVTSPIVITNPGFGYTYSNPPQALIEYPKLNLEDLTDISTIQGFSGKITDIQVVVGIGVPLGLQFQLNNSISDYSTLQVGYPIYVKNTFSGNGIISIDTGDSDIVGVGTTCVDNIYYVHAIDVSTGIVTCNIISTANTIGINSTGTLLDPVGEYSWGRLNNITRSDSALSLTVKGNTLSGLTTYPFIQRRGYGLRDTGSIRKSIN